MVRILRTQDCFTPFLAKLDTLRPVNGPVATIQPAFGSSPVSQDPASVFHVELVDNMDSGPQMLSRNARKSSFGSKHKNHNLRPRTKTIT